MTQEATWRTYVGGRRAKTPARDLYRIPHHERADDGRIIVHAGDHTPICTDCGIGRLMWAEAGYVPWHRICEVCGSHWDLHPIAWGPAMPTSTEGRVVGTGRYACGHVLEDPPWCDECGDEIPEIMGDVVPVPKYVRRVDGHGEIPLDPEESLQDSGATWGDLLALITPDHWAAASDPDSVRRMAGSVTVPCCWARRARIYTTR